MRRICSNMLLGKKLSRLYLVAHSIVAEVTGVDGAADGHVQAAPPSGTSSIVMNLSSVAPIRRKQPVVGVSICWCCGGASERREPFCCRWGLSNGLEQRGAGGQLCGEPGGAWLNFGQGRFCAISSEKRRSYTVVALDDGVLRVENGLVCPYDRRPSKLTK